MSEAITDPATLVFAYEGQLMNAVALGDRARADEALAAVEALAERLRQPAFEAHARILRAAHLLLTGRLDDAEREIHDLEAFQQVHQLAPNGPASLMYRLYYERGRLGEIQALIEALVDSQPDVPTWRVAMAGVYANTDQHDAARPHIEALTANDYGIVARNQLWVVTVAGVARTAAVVGMLDVAERALDLMAPFGHTIAVTGLSYEQPVGMSTGVAAAALGRWEQAEHLFAQALDVSRRAGAPTFVAITEVSWAQALVDRGRAEDAERARELATGALTTAQQLGLGRVEVLSRRVLGS
jgi:tetratricopeptide (TPR) repeat protein